MVVLVVLVCACSQLDAVLTILHIQHGGREGNPLMALALAQSTTAFVWIKAGVTGLGTWVLAAHQHVPVASTGLYGLAVGYGLLLVYHLVLAVGYL
jgi:formate hydrogenlyase subunit 3/multisubunit Na+/H+ antiporter MnhD subunit